MSALLGTYMVVQLGERRVPARMGDFLVAF